MASPEQHMNKVLTILAWIRRSEETTLPAQQEQIIAHCGRTWGTARQTAQNYLKELAANKDIVIDGTNVWSTDKFKQILEARNQDYREGKVEADLDEFTKKAPEKSANQELKSTEVKNGNTEDTGEPNCNQDDSGTANS